MAVAADVLIFAVFCVELRSEAELAVAELVQLADAVDDEQPDPSELIISYSVPQLSETGREGPFINDVSKTFETFSDPSPAPYIRISAKQNCSAAKLGNSKTPCPNVQRTSVIHGWLFESGLTSMSVTGNSTHAFKRRIHKCYKMFHNEMSEATKPSLSKVPPRRHSQSSSQRVVDEWRERPQRMERSFLLLSARSWLRKIGSND